MSAVPLRGPAFSSYPPADVSWLLTDLSEVELEAPIEEREEAIQAGHAHYAESLPVEYQPTEPYQRLFDNALAATGRRLALAVGVTTELVLHTRGTEVVLASLARAGTPVGILMRHWSQRTRGLDLAHYTLSIVRGRGIDRVALAHLAASHRTQDVVFVDGWTGKGAIARELGTALADVNASFGTNYDDRLAVLADTGHCVETYGTREDFLIASACLNSTVSGLVSRTVLNDTLIGPGDFHGAKFYAHLREVDRSVQFLDTVEAYFDEVIDEARAGAQDLLARDRTPTWSGWAAVETLRVQHGLGSTHLVKPGVGETTRVLLRRVPWKVLVRPGLDSELALVLHLAAQRGVDVEEVPGLAYSCVGLIRPRRDGR